MTQEKLVAQFRETGRPVDDRHAGQTLHVRHVPPVGDGTDRWCARVQGAGQAAESTVAICPSHDVAMDWAGAHGAALTVSHEAIDRALVQDCSAEPADAGLLLPAVRAGPRRDR